MICVACGFNTQSGEKMAVKRLAPKRSRAETGATIWPMVIGIICTVLGGPGVLLYGFGLIAALISGSLSSMNQKQMLISLGGQGVGFSMSAWQLLAGIGVMRRRSAGFYLLRRWAVLTFILTLVFGGLLALALSAANQVGPNGEQIDQRTIDVMSAVLAVAIAAGLVWPGFLLFWTMRKSIVAEVDEHFE